MAKFLVVLVFVFAGLGSYAFYYRSLGDQERAHNAALGIGLPVSAYGSPLVEGPCGLYVEQQRASSQRQGEAGIWALIAEHDRTVSAWWFEGFLSWAVLVLAFRLVQAEGWRIVRDQ